MPGHKAPVLRLWTPTGRTTAADPSRRATRRSTQITRDNVGALKVAWTYDTGDAFEGSEMQCQPVVAHGVLYATSPKLRVFALDAATGQPRSGASTRSTRRSPRRARASAG